jgi:hypothetical protein
MRKYKKQSAKLRNVASVRDMAARALRALCRNTKIVAILPTYLEQSLS